MFRLPILFVVCALTVALVGCEGDGESSCSVGTETCQCYPNSTCNDGLECLSGLCVRLGSPDAYLADVGKDLVQQPETLACPMDCSSRGECNNQTGKCQCDEGFAAPGCDECDKGYEGYPNCYRVFACPFNCSGHGNCNAQTGACLCLSCYGGAACDSCSSNCVGQYPDCYVPVDCPAGCSAHGTCNSRTGVCSCASGYYGADCGSCAPGYKGYPLCYEIRTCPLNCSSHGTCDDKTGVCSCDTGFGGAACNSCASEYKGYPNCYQPVACPLNCSGHGTCNDKTGVCTCDTGFTGSACASCASGYQDWGSEKCVKVVQYDKAGVSITVDKFCGNGEFSGGDKDFDSSTVNVSVNASVQRSGACLNFSVTATFAENNWDWTKGTATRTKQYCILPSSAACQFLTQTSYSFSTQTNNCDQWYYDYAPTSTLVDQIKFMADTDGDDVGNCEAVGPGSGSGAIVTFMTVKVLCKL